MSFNFYRTTITPCKHALNTLSHILTKASQQPNASSLPAARLAPDMRPLSSQIHLTAQQIERLLARLDHKQHLQTEDTLATFEDMHARIAAAHALLDATDEATVNSRGDEVAPTDLTAGLVVDMSAAAFAEGAMANVYFHVSIAYAILRMQGVPLGKPDYIMPFVKEHLEGVDVAGALARRAAAAAENEKKE
ncbi:hypothetical protein Q7P37_009133 [Cladosporium fusiforme]